MATLDLSACIRDPNSRECQETRKHFRDLLEIAYFSRFIEIPRFPIPIPRPDPPPNVFDPNPRPNQPGEPNPQPSEPNPQPNFPSLFDVQQALNGEMLLSTLRQDNLSPVLQEIKDSGLQRQVAQALVDRFEPAVESLKNEIKELG